MGSRSAQLLVGNILAGNRFDHVRSRDVHLTGAADHKHKIGYGRRVYCPSRCRSHDHRDLGYHPGEQGITQEDIPVGGQAGDPFLDPRTPGVVKTHKRAAGLGR